MNEDQRHVANCLREEMVERIRLKTQINWFKVGALGGLLSMNNSVVLWILPFVAISFDFSMLHNAIYINTIGDYLNGYPTWRHYEQRFHTGQGFWRWQPDLVLDRLSYFGITCLAITYTLLKVTKLAIFYTLLGRIWFGVLVGLFVLELFMLRPTVAREP